MVHLFDKEQDPIIRYYSESTNIKLQEDLAIFMDHNFIFKKLKRAVEKYVTIINYVKEKKTILPLFQCTIPIDLLLLHNKTEYLYNTFVLEPKLAIDLLKGIVLSALHQYEVAQFLKKEDVYVIPTLTSLPPICNKYSSLKTYRGILVALSEVAKYIRSRLWVCSDDCCEGAAGQRTFEETVSTCWVCAGSVVEDVRGRDMGDMMLCKFVPADALHCDKGTYMPLTACLKDNIVNEELLELGMEFCLVGVEVGAILEIWNITRYVCSVQAILQSPHNHNIPISPQISHLYLTVRECFDASPWAFVGALACQMASDILPISSCINLKFGLLLSLASQKGKTCPVGVVAIGSETSLARILMNSASNFAERKVLASGESLEGLIKCDPVKKVVWSEAGDVSLAATGVCLLGDWSKYKSKNQLSGAVACLENGGVTLDSRVANVAPKTLPLRACMWTYWGDVTSNNRDQSQLRTLIDVFGMPYLSEELESNENEKICSNFLNAATCGDCENENNPIATDEMRHFLTIVTSREIQMSSEASELITKYFVVSRRERPQCLSVGAIQTMTSLAEAHARLSLRQIVTPADVALVIFLYQETIDKLFGSSQTSGYHKLSYNQEEPMFEYIHRQMINFTKWLQKYLIPE